MLSEKILHSIVTEESSVPGKFLEEIRAFILRNLIFIRIQKNGGQHKIKKICHICLKAHIIKTASEMRQTENPGIKSILSRIECGDNHNGYYLDNDRVLKWRAT